MSIVDELRLAASRHALGLLSPEEMVRLADSALTDGHYSGPIDELATYRLALHPSTVELEPIFLKWLEESGVPFPNPEEAAWSLLRMTIGRIVRGEVPPLHGLGEVVQVCLRTPDPERLGLGALYAAHSVQDELADGPVTKEHREDGRADALAQLEYHVGELFHTWWKVYGPSPSLSPESPEAARLRGPVPPTADIDQPRSVPPWRSRIYVIAYSVWVAIVVAAIALFW